MTNAISGSYAEWVFPQILNGKLLNDADQCVPVIYIETFEFNSVMNSMFLVIRWQAYINAMHHGIWSVDGCTTHT